MKRIIICRHGQDEDNAEGLLNGRRDRQLTELGRSQAATIAAQIAEQHADIDRIFCSPLQRAHHTALVIAEQIGKQPQPHPDLLERDFGVLSGKPLTDIPRYASAIHRTEHVTYFLDGDGVESFEDCYARASRLLDALHTEAEGQVVLLVCHGDIAKMLMAAHRNMSWREALDAPYIPNTGLVVL